jgi:hypothetical protein
MGSSFFCVWDVYSQGMFVNSFGECVGMDE